MAWINTDGDRETLLNRLPELREKFAPFYASFFNLPQLPASTVELCRLRLAQLHKSEVEWEREEVALDSNKRSALRQWNTDAQFTEAERACLSFTEVYAIDAAAISDKLADDVKQHHGSAGLVALIQALGVLDGLTRMSLLWQLPAPAHSETTGA